MTGYIVILDVGMSGKEVEFPDANCYTFKDGYLTIGDGTTNTIGVFEGNKHGVFLKSNVAGVLDMDDL